MLTALGIGWTYVLLAGLCILVGPIMYVTMRMGPKWRAKERERQAIARQNMELKEKHMQ